MMIDPALFRNISLQTNDQGTADALLALAARRMIDKDGGIQIDPDDLPATMRRLGDVGGVPMWLKFRITAAQIPNGTLDAGGSLVLPLFTASAVTMIMGAFIAPVESFDQDPEADPQLTGLDTLSVGVQWRTPDDSLIGYLSMAGYADGPQIVGDPTYTEIANSLAPIVNDGQVVTGFIAIPSQNDPDPPTLEDYQKIIAGGFDVWLLVAKLPA
jgi:hypothetical protein